MKRTLRQRRESPDSRHCKTVQWKRGLPFLHNPQRETSPDDIRFIRYLQGMHDAFNRVVLFLDCHDKRND